MTTLTSAEQLMLEMINRARMDPDAEAARIAQTHPGFTLNEALPAGTISSAPKQVLAGSNNLTAVAESHDAAMLNSHVLDYNNSQILKLSPHDNAGDGLASTRLANAGFPTFRENVAWQGIGGDTLATAIQKDEDGLFFDSYDSGRGHRLAIMDPNMRIVGVGETTGSVNWIDQATGAPVTFSSVVATEDFSTAANPFLTGAVYNDANGNRFYDLNEGVAGVTAKVTTTAGALIGSDITGSGGGWSVSEPGGTYNVTFTGPGIAAGGVTATVEGGSLNAKVDLVNGNEIYSNASTTLGAGAKNVHLLGLGNINATGNALDNLFYVNKGTHNIAGGGGFDTVVYSGTMASYTITRNASGTVTVSSANGTDTLTSIAKLQFSDQSVDLTPPAPVNHAPVVTAHDTTIAANAAVAMSALFTAHDQDGDNTISKYLIMDAGAGGGHLEVNGVAQAALSWVQVDAANLGSVKYVGGSAAGSEVIDVQAYDGKDWSANAAVTVTTLAPPNHAPVVTGHDTTVAAHAAIGVSSLFTAHDQDGDSTISKYMIMDSGAGGGHLEVNGIAQAALSWVQVDAANLGSVKYVGGSTAGSEVLDIQAFDGKDWSANAAVTVKTLAPAADDFNADGKSDILWVNNNGSVATWQTDGAQITANQGVGSVGTGWHFAGSGDFNGDGKSDILWFNDTGAVAEWQMNGSQIAANQTVGSAATTWHIAETGDYTRDGKADVLWHNDNGATAVWEMSGSQIIGNHTVGTASTDWHIA